MRQISWHRAGYPIVRTKSRFFLSPQQMVDAFKGDYWPRYWFDDWDKALAFIEEHSSDEFTDLRFEEV